jgi:hypothetical protein
MGALPRWSLAEVAVPPWIPQLLYQYQGDLYTWL